MMEQESKGGGRSKVHAEAQSAELLAHFTEEEIAAHRASMAEILPAAFERAIEWARKEFLDPDQSPDSSDMSYSKRR